MRSMLNYPVLWGIVLALFFFIPNSSPYAEKEIERALIITNDEWFDYGTWIMDAAWLKLKQNALGMPHYLNHEQRKTAVNTYLRLVGEVEKAEQKLNQVFADPAITDKETAAAPLREELAELNRQQDALAPYVESILQEQVSAIIAESGLSLGGQPIPATLYHVSPLPLNLIISPRERIEQLGSVSLRPGLNAEEKTRLEAQTDQTLDVSSIIEPVGGIGVYPTMIMRTTSLEWLVEVIAHEWAHNYLTLRPLGISYDTSPQLRTMNETTASIVGNEIGRLVIEKYYPERLSRNQSHPELVSRLLDRPDPNDIRIPFDYRREMHETRVTADALLAEGKIEEAEAYMEQRRQFFWDNGYAIRKINQAYFAFYGAYADVPGGAAGEDPVGPAVRRLREISPSLADFVNTIAWMTNFDQLLEAVK